MRGKIISLLFVIFILLALPVAADDGETSECVAGDKYSFSASLTTEEDANLHTFEMSADGVAVIKFEIPDAGTTFRYWQATVYASDGETVIGEAGVKDQLSPTYICLADLERGSYTVKVTKGSRFSNKSYGLTVITGYPESLPDGNKKTVREMDGVGLICEIDGYSFVKMGEGRAYAALYRVADGGSVLPMLIGDTEESVEYICVQTGDVVKATSAELCGKDRYYSYADWLDGYHGTGYQRYTSNELFLAENSSSAFGDAEAILVRHEKNEKGIIIYFLSHYWGWILFAVLAGVAIWVKIKIFPSSGDDGDDDFTGGYGSGGSFVPPPDDDSDAYGRPYGPGGPPDIKGI